MGRTAVTAASSRASLALGPVWRAAWSVWKKHALRLAAIGAVMYVLDLALRSAGFATDAPEGFIEIMLTVVMVIIMLIGYLAMLFIIKDGRETVSAIREGFYKTAPYLLLSIMTGLIVGGSFILLIVPGIIVMVYLSMVSYVFIWEGRHGVAAMETSWWRVRGSWWQTFGHLVIALLIIFIIPTLCELFFGGPTPVKVEIVGAIIEILLLPFFFVYLSVVYQALYARTGGSLPDEAGTKKRHRLLLQLPAIAVVVIGLFLWWLFH